MRKMIAMGVAAAAALLLCSCGGQPTDGGWLSTNLTQNGYPEYIYLQFQGNAGTVGMAWVQGAAGSTVGMSVGLDRGPAQINNDGTLSYAFAQGDPSDCLSGCPYTASGGQLTLQANGGSWTFKQASGQDFSTARQSLQKKVNRAEASAQQAQDNKQAHAQKQCEQAGGQWGGYVSSWSGYGPSCSLSYSEAVNGWDYTFGPNGLLSYDANGNIIPTTALDNGPAAAMNPPTDAQAKQDCETGRYSLVSMWGGPPQGAPTDGIWYQKAQVCLQASQQA